MIISEKRKDLRQILDPLQQGEKSLGFVPTMGALHEGHLSLIKKALHENAHVVVSIFVNPTQFDNGADLEKYPRTLERDLDLLKSVSDDIIVYAPSDKDIYGDEVASEHFNFDGLEHQMEGKFRPGHFDGVGTIVKRLFEIVKPDVAYFGLKDFQQFKIIEKLVEKQQLPIKIEGCEIFREPDGLAMSSRNERLSKPEREAAPFIYKTLQHARALFGTESATKVVDWVKEEFEKNKILKLEYFIIADEDTLQPIQNKSETKSYRAFIAAFANDVRLIDNIALN